MIAIKDSGYFLFFSFICSSWHIDFSSWCFSSPGQYMTARAASIVPLYNHIQGKYKRSTFFLPLLLRSKIIPTLKAIISKKHLGSVQTWFMPGARRSVHLPRHAAFKQNYSFISQDELWEWLFILALFIIIRNLKHSKCLLVGE